jgi:hypothetical protein
MNILRSLARWCAPMALAGCLAFTVGCAQAASPGQQPVPSAPPEIAVPVALNVKTDRKTYRVNEPIKFTLTARNTSKSPASLNFASSQKYDFFLRKGKSAAGKPFWKWSLSRVFAQSIDTVSLGTGKSLTFIETYKPGGKSGDGRPLPSLAPGTYTVTAAITVMGRGLPPMTSTTFQIQ